MASTNPGKIREILQVLDRLPITIETLAGRPSIPEPEESGLTFAANAELKAAYYARQVGMPVVAEDSGLAIDALGGRPGVLSARYPGETYGEKFVNLYRELAPHARPWTARFVCSLALVDVSEDRALGTGPLALASAQRPTPSAHHMLFSCEATVEGEIAPAPRGAHGFGYDPIFFYPPYGKTLGEATDEEKLVVSHRGRAFRRLRDWIERYGLLR